MPLHVAVTAPPAVTLLGLALSVDEVNVAVTERLAVMLTAHAPLPEQAPLHALSVPVLVVSVTDVPLAKFATHMPDEQLLMPGGLLVTAPVPVTVTESVKLLDTPLVMVT